jgi:hypothetical protein
MIKPPSPNPQNKPGLISSITTGFEAVARHPYLIIPPILLDLFLWFGPRMRVKEIAAPFIASLKQPVEIQSADFTQLFGATKDLYLLLVERFNLFSGLRSLPVGIPSLISSLSPTTNPIGNPISWEAGSLNFALLFWVVAGIVGMLGASIYYSLINRVINHDEHPINPGTIGWQTMQLVSLAIICILAGVFILVPALMLVSFLTLVSPVLGQVGMLAVGIFLLSLLVPLLFAPQGIYMQHLTANRAIVASSHLTRLNRPSVSLFFLAMVILSQGLALLWQVPDENSWFLLVGIIGHALVSTSLLSAVFIFYRENIKWAQAFLSQVRPAEPTGSPRNG